MTKRTIDIDDDLLEQVRAYFGTKTIKDTVNEALEHVAGIPERIAAIEWWKTDPCPDLRNKRIMRRAWRKRPTFWSTKARLLDYISYRLRKFWRPC